MYEISASDPPPSHNEKALLAPGAVDSSSHRHLTSTSATSVLEKSISIHDLVSSSRGFHDSSAATELYDLGPSAENSADKRYAGHVQLETGADGGKGLHISGPELASDEQVYLQVGYYLQRLSRFGTEMTFLVAALVLGSFGSFMSGRSLWVCWAILLLKLLVDFSIRPSWTWLISYLSTRSSTGTAKLCRGCPPSGLAISAGDRVRGESSVVIIKLVLVFVLLMEVNHPGLSAGCSQPPCSHRAKESMTGLAVMVLVLEGVPLLLSGVVQAKVGGCIGFERVVKSYHLLRHAVHELRRDANLTWLQFTLILQSFHASASSAVLVSTAGLLVGGNFGSFMTGKCFWFCMFVVVVEIVAERACPVAIEIFRYCRPRGVHPSSTITEKKQQYEEQADNTKLEDLIAKRGLSEVNIQLKEEAIAKLLLRVPIHTIICRFLIKVVHENTVYPRGLDNNSCDATCRANTKALLEVLCIFTGSQVLSIVPLWAPLQILAALIPGSLVFGLFHFLRGVIAVIMVAAYDTMYIMFTAGNPYLRKLMGFLAVLVIVNQGGGKDRFTLSKVCSTWKITLSNFDEKDSKPSQNFEIYMLIFALIYNLSLQIWYKPAQIVMKRL